MFFSIMERERSYHAKTLSGRQRRFKDAATFIDSLREEVEKIHLEPAVLAYDCVLSPSLNVPDKVAATLAELLEIEFGNLNWKTAWQMAAPILNEGFAREISLEFDKVVSTYLEAIKAAEKERCFSLLITRMEAIKQGFPLSVDPFEFEQVQYPAYLDEEIQLNFEDWQHRRFPDSLQYISNPFEKKRIKDNYGDWRLFTLSEIEYQKIKEARNTIFESCTAFFLKGLVETFEQQLNDSFEKEDLIKLELSRITQYLTDKDFLDVSFPFSHPNGDKGKILFGAISKDFLGTVGDVNVLQQWFEKIIVRGNDARIYAEPGYERVSDFFPPAFAVHVLHQYRQFLEKRLGAIASPSKALQLRSTKAKDKTAAVQPMLNDAINDAEIFLPRLWMTLSTLPDSPFDVTGQTFIWSKKKRGKNAVLYALAKALTIRKKLAIDADAEKIYLVLCQHFEQMPASRPDKLTKGKRVYQDWYNTFLDEIKPL